MNDKEKTISNAKPLEKDELTRRDAIRKIGYAAFATTTMLLLLNNPTKVYASSPGDPDDDWEW
jgi:hypothetical protein